MLNHHLLKIYFRFSTVHWSNANIFVVTELWSIKDIFNIFYQMAL